MRPRCSSSVPVRRSHACTSTSSPLAYAVWRAAAFYVLGLGLYSFVNFGLLGTYSTQLRWAFSVRIAMMLFVIPAGLALGLPVSLARQTVRRGRLRSVVGAVARGPMKLFGNSAVAPIGGLVVLSMMLTPLAGIARLSPTLEGLLSLAIPLLGLLMVLPMVEEQTRVSTSVIMLEFVFAFIELLADAAPGLVMRLSPNIFDGAAALTGAVPGWFPDALRDQQLAGDFLWFIAEIMDLPIMILLFMRFSKSDKGERRIFDELTDEQLEELNAAHLGLRD